MQPASLERAIKEIQASSRRGALDAIHRSPPVRSWRIRRGGAALAMAWRLDAELRPDPAISGPGHPSPRVDRHGLSVAQPLARRDDLKAGLTDAIRVVEAELAQIEQCLDNPQLAAALAEDGVDLKPPAAGNGPHAVPCDEAGPTPAPQGVTAASGHPGRGMSL